MQRFISATDTFTELMLWYIGVIVLGALLFCFFEHKPFDEGIWWAFVTAVTVGYGDVYPVTLGGRLVAIVLMHSVVFVVGPIIIGRLLNKVFADASQFTHEEQEQIKKELAEIKALLIAQRDNSRATQSSGGT